MEKFTSITGRVLNRRGLIAVGATATLALTLSACSSAEIEPETPVTVTSHEYDDPDTWVSFIPAGKTIVPIMHHDPEHFILHLEQCGRTDEPSADENGCLQFAREVAPDEYNDIQDGEVLYFHQDPQTHELTYTVNQ